MGGGAERRNHLWNSSQSWVFNTVLKVSQDWLWLTFKNKHNPNSTLFTSDKSLIVPLFRSDKSLIIPLFRSDKSLIIIQFRSDKSLIITLFRSDKSLIITHLFQINLYHPFTSDKSLIITHLHQIKLWSLPIYIRQIFVIIITTKFKDTFGIWSCRPGTSVLSQSLSGTSDFMQLTPTKISPQPPPVLWVWTECCIHIQSTPATLCTVGVDWVLYTYTIHPSHPLYCGCGLCECCIHIQSTPATLCTVGVDCVSVVYIYNPPQPPPVLWVWTVWVL